MSYNIFLASDHHMNHANCLTFKKNDGTPLRPYSSVEEMNEALIDNHNSVVRPQDKIYMLGDVAMNKKGLEMVKRMNGTKILIKGNHDCESLSKYAEIFKDVRAVHPLEKGFVLTHVPLHPDCLERWGINVHGHLHSNRVQINCGEDWSGDMVHADDPRYFCACVEQINFTPIAFEEIKRIVRERV